MANHKKRPLTSYQRETLAQWESGDRVVDIAERRGVSTAAIYNLLAILRERGLVRRRPDKASRPGPSIAKTTPAPPVTFIDLSTGPRASVDPAVTRLRAVRAEHAQKVVAIDEVLAFLDPTVAMAAE